MYSGRDGIAALPYFDEFDLSTIDVLLISQYVPFPPPPPPPLPPPRSLYTLQWSSLRRNVLRKLANEQMLSCAGLGCFFSYLDPVIESCTRLDQPQYNDLQTLLHLEMLLSYMLHISSPLLELLL
jgi:hypothetical protein